MQQIIQISQNISSIETIELPTFTLYAPNTLDTLDVPPCKNFAYKYEHVIWLYQKKKSNNLLVNVIHACKTQTWNLIPYPDSIFQAKFTQFLTVNNGLSHHK